MQTAPSTLLTVEDWLQWDVPEGFRAELVDGEIQMTPSAQPRHQRTLDWLTRQLSAFLEAHPESQIWWSSPCRFPIPALDKARGREADLGIYDQSPEAGKAPDWKTLRPVIVVEVVSPGEEKRDYVEKRRDYHKAGVPEYWIVDPEQQVVWALRWLEHGWSERIIEGEATYSSMLLRGFSLSIQKLWT